MYEGAIILEWETVFKFITASFASIGLVVVFGASPLIGLS